MKSISIIIPAYNDAVHLERTLRQLEHIRHVEWLDLEIIVSVRPSTDATAAVAHQWADHVVVGGMVSRARNAGAAVARGEVLIFLDADTTPAIGTLTTLAQAAAPDTIGSCTAYTKARSWKAKLTVWGINFLRWSGFIKGLSNALFCHRSLWHERGIHYNEKISLGEHFDFIRRARREAGCRFIYVRTQSGYMITMKRYERWGYAQSLLFWIHWGVRSMLLQKNTVRLEQTYWNTQYRSVHFTRYTWTKLIAVVLSLGGLMIGAMMTWSALIGPRRAVLQLFAEELAEDPSAPFVRLLLVVADSIELSTLIVLGVGIACISLISLLMSGRNLPLAKVR